MTAAGRTAPLSRRPAPFTRWPVLAASALGILSVAVIAANFWMAEVAS